MLTDYRGDAWFLCTLKGHHQLLPHATSGFTACYGVNGKAGGCRPVPIPTSTRPDQSGDGSAMDKLPTKFPEGDKRGQSVVPYALEHVNRIYSFGDRDFQPSTQARQTSPSGKSSETIGRRLGLDWWESMKSLNSIRRRWGRMVNWFIGKQPERESCGAAWPFHTLGSCPPRRPNGPPRFTKVMAPASTLFSFEIRHPLVS